MQCAKSTPLPELTSDRLIERITEAMQIGLDPAKFSEFPAWTQRVMRILRDQLVPREFVQILSVGESVFAEGVSVAWVAAGPDLMRTPNASAGQFARELVDRLAAAAEVKDVVAKVESGEFCASQEFQKQIMTRLFASNFAERRAFAEGLAVGNRLHELLDRQTKRSTTDATGIYLMLWLYWPEIGKLRSVGEVARVLEPFLAKNRNLAGVHWEERIRKLANRIRLSFRAKQKRRRKAASK
ncbi:MAG: hypothetical protein ABI273_09240 [Lacunisphaera sp.]